MSRRVRYDAEAKEELREASRWYEAQRKLLGRRLLDTVGATIVRIREAPRSFPVIDHVRGGRAIRRANLADFPYGLVFVELADEIRILAVAHLHRRPGYWRHRATR
jgi:hypothetical protein